MRHPMAMTSKNELVNNVNDTFQELIDCTEKLNTDLSTQLGRSIRGVLQALEAYREFLEDLEKELNKLPEGLELDLGDGLPLDVLEPEEYEEKEV
jgi:hypothetical protein